MKVSPINDFKVQPQFGSNNEVKEKTTVAVPEQKPEVKEPKGYSTMQVGGAVLATALSAAALGGAVMHGRAKSKISSLAHNNQILEAAGRKLEEVNKGLDEAVQAGQSRIKGLLKDNETINELNTALSKELEETKGKFNDIFEGDIAPKDIREKIYNQFKGKIDEGKLNYDIEKPPVTGRGEAPVYTDAIEMPVVGTVNRAGMSELTIPNFNPDAKFEFKLPTSSEVKITKVNSIDFKPKSNQLTNITESYADSVQWNNDKIARDVLQNFFDGHGQTLDGVELSFVPVGNNKYRVRIKGDSTYTADKAVYIGESTKRDDVKAAGNYGEGLKMSVLKLLKDGGASDVKIGSDNWKLTYSLAKGDLSDKRVLAYSLDKVNNFDGNYIEFETADTSLLETFRKSINRFYHSHNSHFKCPEFENDLLGVKVLGPNEKGGLYIAGQRFEFNNDYDGLNNIALFLKEKPPVKVLDPSRDRTSLNQSQLEDIAGWLAQESRMSNQDKAKLLKTLEPYWDHKSYGSETPLDAFVNRFLNYTNWQSDNNPLHIKFPSTYVAYSSASSDVVMDLRRSGYKVCKSNFNKLGMPTIKDLLGDVRAHDVVVPNEIQTKKIMILKEAISNLGKTLKDKHFTADELDTKIYMFDNTGAKDSRMYSNTTAEAIIDNKTSKGFWIDKNYLDESNFSGVLETALHELCHKAGGDESAEFSYKLTNVNRDAINQMLNDVQSRNELQALNKLWEDLGKAQKPVITEI